MAEKPTQPEFNSKDLYLRLLSHVRPYWRQFAMGILFMVILALTEPAIPILLKPLLDGTFVEKDPSFLFWSPIVLILLFATRGIFSFASQAAFAWVSGKLVLDLRVLMFDRLLALPTAYYDANATGNIINKVTNNVTQVTAAATRVLMVLVRDTVSIIGLLGYMLYLNWKFSLMVFAILPILMLAVRVLAKRLRALSRGRQAMIGDMTHSLEESIRGQRVVKVFNGQDVERERFNVQSNWVRRYTFKEKIADAASMPLVESIAAVLIALLIYTGTGQMGKEALTVGGFVSFLAALGLLFPPIKRLVGVNQPLQRGLAGAESVFEMLDEQAEKDQGTDELGRVRGELEFQDVSFCYAAGESDALSEISFQVHAGTTVALVGHSGSGKTTIASLVPRFYDPESGRILIDGKDIQSVTLHSLRNNISYVGQESTLFNTSIAENIAYGMDPAPSAEDLQRAAEAAFALDFIQELPDGFDTMVGEDGVRLSGGQRQRIAIARALLKDAPILILDEATSALDTESERHVQAALSNLTKNRTTLVIAHRLSTIEHADNILVLKAGRIVESGRHQQLIAKQGVYAKLHQHAFQDEES